MSSSSSSSQQDRKGDSNKKPKAKKAKGQQNQGEKMTEEEMQNRMKVLEKRLEAAEKEAKEKDKIIQDKDTLLQDKDRLLQDERKRIKLVEEEKKKVEEEKKKAEEEAKDKDRLRQGTYYATFDEVWGPDPVSFEESDYDAMIRDNFPSYRSENEKMDSHFSETMTVAKDLQNAAAFDSSRATLGTAMKLQIWPVHVLESKFLDRNGNTFLKIEGAGHHTSIASELVEPPSSAPLAHLVPHSPQSASLYYHVAIWVFGQETRHYEPSVVQKLIHGSVKPRAPETGSVQDPPAAKGSVQNPMSTKAYVQRPTTTKGSVQPRAPETGSAQDPPPVKGSVQNPRPTKRSVQNPRPAKRSVQILTPTKGSVQPQAPETGSVLSSTSSRGRQKVPWTGLKHMVCNKIRLFGQEDCFDKLPCVIIVPVLSLKQAKEWKGEGYDAIFMISTGSQEKGSHRPLKTVAASLHFLDVGEVANETEISSARELLTATIKGLAFALGEKSAATENWVGELSDNVKEVLEGIRNNSTVVTGEKKIMVPKRRDREKDVRKITFAPAFGPVGNDGHPAPDPILLTVKAALNWSIFHKQKLIAAGECNDSDSQTSEFSLAAMEEYLAMREHDERVSRDEEIMDMIIRIS